MGTPKRPGAAPRSADPSSESPTSPVGLSFPTEPWPSALRKLDAQWLGEREQNAEPALRPGPQLLDDLASCGARDVGDRCRDENCVVQLPGYRNEVGDEIERHGEVRDQQHQRQLRPARHSLVVDEPFAENEAVRDEACDVACVAASAEQQQQDDQEQPQRRRCAERDGEPGPAAQAATGRRWRMSSAI